MKIKTVVMNEQDGGWEGSFVVRAESLREIMALAIQLERLKASAPEIPAQEQPKARATRQKAAPASAPDPAAVPVAPAKVVLELVGLGKQVEAWGDGQKFHAQVVGSEVVYSAGTQAEALDLAAASLGNDSPLSLVPAEKAAPAESNGSAQHGGLPAELLAMTSFRQVLLHLMAAGLKEPEIADRCAAWQQQIPAIARVSGDIRDRVARAMIVVASEK